jgi:hypothetical protein
MNMEPARPHIEISPADWAGFEDVMGPRGGCGGCWCMLWRRSKSVMEAEKGDRNRAAMQRFSQAAAARG